MAVTGDPCACGADSCSINEYCNVDADGGNGLCSANAWCTNTGGTTLNSGICNCGTSSMCVSDGYCTVDSDGAGLCFTAATCPNTTGDVVNDATATCQCGYDSHCDSAAPYCTAAYGLKASGSCLAEPPACIDNVDGTAANSADC